MNTKTLLGLSKEELIKIIEDFKLKEALASKGIPELQIDFRSIVESAGDIIIVLDDNGNMVYHNKAWSETFPYSDGQALGMHISASVPAIEIERATALSNTVIRGDSELLNERFRTIDKHGNTVYFLANMTPIKSPEGNNMGMLAILRNITEMHMMERKIRMNSRQLEEKVREQIEQAEELKRLKALNEDIIHTAPIGIFTMDSTGIILTENPAVKSIVGLGPNETIVGTNFSGLSEMSPSAYQRMMDDVFINKKPQRVKNFKYHPPRGDGEGEERTLNLSINPIFDNERRVKSSMVMVEDVTEQTRVGKKMHRAEQLSAMGLLAAGVAYELKVPINLLTVDLNFLSNNIDENSPMMDYIKSMKDEIERMKQISDHLLNLTKPEETDKELFEANKLVTTHPIQIMLNRLEKNGFTVSTSYPDKSLMIRGIKNQLVQVLLHIIANAEEACESRKELKITVENIKTAKGDFAAITVEDSGIGISQEHIKKVFQPFFTTKGEKSTGLGLMVSYSIIENHGGTIGIRSKPGEGTAIKIILPGVEE